MDLLDRARRRRLVLHPEYLNRPTAERGPLDSTESAASLVRERHCLHTHRPGHHPEPPNSGWNALSRTGGDSRPDGRRSPAAPFTVTPVDLLGSSCRMSVTELARPMSLVRKVPHACVAVNHQGVNDSLPGTEILVAAIRAHVSEPLRQQKGPGTQGIHLNEAFDPRDAE